MAELLWQERLKSYRELLAAIDVAVGAVIVSAKAGTQQGKEQAAAQHLILQRMNLQLYPIASRGVGIAVKNLGEFLWSKHEAGIGTPDEFGKDFYPRLLAVVDAMRADIDPMQLDKLSKEILLRIPPTRIHESAKTQ
jgi:hypothetical protein